MNTGLQLVVFSLQDQLYALRLATVDRIVRVAGVTALPQAPDIVLGVINIHGGIVPVVNVRRRFGLPEREIELADRLIVARTSSRPVALLVSSVEGVVDCAVDQIVSGEKIVNGARYVEGVLKLGDGMILIHDLDTFLSPLEDRELTRALASA